MQRVLNFLQDNKIFYLATTDGDQPRVRPFGIAIEYKGKLCIGTGSGKDVYKQLIANPKAEISATDKDGVFLRVSGTLKTVNDTAAKEKFFEVLPRLKVLYSGDTAQTFTVLAFENAQAVFQNGQAKEAYTL
ncbi:MAG: pyridoxamine 5'-phosphate oxidase family protein [Clostridiales bacterium]|jgi:uncharacterized pyridoxamine 5'-phosphate oxidase family protein|nr:pyridoxamine 5'-phosphate oxidase family protein [Clostridiales bacterium]